MYIASKKIRVVMKKYLFIFIFTLPFFLTGCSNYEEIRIIKVKDVSYEELRGGMLRLAITATIDNPNLFKVKITNANMELRLQDRVLGNVSQIEKIELLGRTQKDYTMRISIEMKDLMSNAINIYRLFMNDPRDLNLSGTVDVRSFLYSKTFNVERLSFQ